MVTYGIQSDAWRMLFYLIPELEPGPSQTAKPILPSDSEY
jgi:hypothetical protein